MEGATGPSYLSVDDLVPELRVAALVVVVEEEEGGEKAEERCQTEFAEEEFEEAGPEEEESWLPGGADHDEEPTWAEMVGCDSDGRLVVV